MKVKDILIYELGKDTRDQKDLHIYKIKNQLSKDDYIKLNKALKNHRCYYSKFVKGFISKNGLLDENLEINLNSQKVVKKTKSSKVEYHKNLLDYITLEEYKEFLKEYAKENYTNYYRRHSVISTDKAIQEYTQELLNNVKLALQYDSFGKLSYIRECIIHKSLGYTLNDRINTNGDGLYYKAIWKKLPIVEDLKLTDLSYSAIWGYDQTNVDIAYKLNKKVWGLDALKCGMNYYLVRIKEDSFHDNVRYFTRDYNPQETFKRDASQTGQYR